MVSSQRHLPIFGALPARIEKLSRNALGLAVNARVQSGDLLSHGAPRLRGGHARQDRAILLHVGASYMACAFLPDSIFPH